MYFMSKKVNNQIIEKCISQVTNINNYSLRRNECPKASQTLAFGTTEMHRI